MGEVVRFPQRRRRSALERAEAWARLSPGERKRRAAEAVRDDDRRALDALFESYLRNYSGPGQRISEQTLSTYGRGMTRLLDWCAEAGRMPHQLDGNDARRFRVALQDGLSDKSVATYLTGARQFHAALRWCELADADPFEGVTIRERTSPREKAEGYYTVDELRRCLEAADLRGRALVLLAADAGLRVSEVSRLQWRDVQLRRGRLRVRRGKGRKQRTVALTGRTADALSALQDAEGGDGAVVGLSRQRIHELFRDLCLEAGVPPRGYHNLRHSCGTRLYRKTQDLLLVARHLGHSTTKTAELYAHLDDRAYQAGVQKLAENGVS